MKKRILFHNFSGRDLPDYSRKSFNSMLVEDGVVAEIGFGLGDLNRLASITHVDLGGAVVMPAFADAHVHLMQTAVEAISVDLTGAADVDEVLERLRTGCAGAHGEWVIASCLDETCLREQRVPTTDELDAVSRGVRLWVNRVDLHSALGNRATLAWLTERARAQHADVSLPPVGLIRNAAFWFAAGEVLRAISAAAKRRGLELAISRCWQQGVATVHALEGGNLFGDADLDLAAEVEREHGLHVVIYHQNEDPREAVRRGWPRFGGCLLVDGSFGSHTAYLSQPYADRPDTMGQLYMGHEKISALIGKAADHELQLALHVIGDRAIDVATAAHRVGFATYGARPLPHRLEHFELPSNDAVRAAVEANLLVSVQPVFETLWGGQGKMYEKRLGSERVMRTNPFKTMMNTGLPLAGGSDSPVTPIAPLAGVHGFVNHPNPDERIDLNSALAAFILEPHRFAGEDEVRGRLQTGYRADFVALSADPFLTPAAKIAELVVQRLFVGGTEKSPREN